jgi:hypothetical protein
MNLILTGMKKLLLIIVVCLSGLLLKGQIQITSADLPVIGNLVVQAVDTITPVSPGSPGINQVWDYSNLIAHRYDSVQCIMPEGLPYYYNYPHSNIVYDAVNPQYEGPIPVYTYLYNHHDVSGLYFVGFEFQFVTEMPGVILNIHVKYADDCLFLPLPLNYGGHHELVQDFETHTAVLYMGTLYDSTKIVNHNVVVYDVDASGTMITPYHTFQVLRVKSVQTSHQMEYTWNGTGWDFVEEFSNGPETDYMWFTNDYFQVGSYAENQRANGFTFFRSETIVGTASPVYISNYTIYPNPVNDIITVDGNNVPSMIEIYNTAGSLIRTEKGVNVLNISDLPRGLYFLKIFSNENIELQKLTKL